MHSWAACRIRARRCRRRPAPLACLARIGGVEVVARPSRGRRPPACCLAPWNAFWRSKMARRVVRVGCAIPFLCCWFVGLVLLGGSLLGEAVCGCLPLAKMMARETSRERIWLWERKFWDTLVQFVIS